MREVRREVFDVPDARRPVFLGDDLYDVGRGWLLVNGADAPQSHYSGYGPWFDAAVLSPAADLVAPVASAGTAALILDRDGRVVRELSRNYYHANAYRYPVALFTLPDGRTGLVHCPEHYNRLEIEDARTGERHGVAPVRDLRDAFHPRLAVSSTGRYLLSAGWLWHPWGAPRRVGPGGGPPRRSRPRLAR